MLVREFKESDREQLRRIYLDSRRATFQWLDTSAYTLADFDTDTAGERILVAVTDNDLISGFAAVWMPDNFIHHLFVAPGSQRQGVGKALLQTATALFDLPVTLKCLTQNHNAVNFYKALGWRVRSKRSDGNGDYFLMSNW